MTDHGFNIRETVFSPKEGSLSIGIANIHAAVPDIASNKSKILAATEIFKEKKVNLAVFPEFCITGYFWEDYEECSRYMGSFTADKERNWVMDNLYPLLEDELYIIVINNIRGGPGTSQKYLNSTFVLNKFVDFTREEYIYDKIMLPGIEKTYCRSGLDDRLVIDTKMGKFGFTTCYDYCFSELLQEYSRIDHVDAVIEVACWRGTGTRAYQDVNVFTDMYYGYLWDTLMASRSATNQFWTIACNAVGKHEISGEVFWGGSGIWAPSGINIVKASNYNEELLIVRNIDIKGERKKEQDDYNYGMDFNEVYRHLEDKRTFTRL
jgi:predicted amidohydrolase